MKIDDQVTVTDEDNKDYTGKVIAVYSDNGKNYILVEVDEMDEVIAFWYDENGELYSIETDAEFDKAEEILNSLD